MSLRRSADSAATLVVYCYCYYLQPVWGGRGGILFGSWRTAIIDPAGTVWKLQYSYREIEQMVGCGVVTFYVSGDQNTESLQATVINLKWQNNLGGIEVSRYQGERISTLSLHEKHKRNNTTPGT